MSSGTGRKNRRYSEEMKSRLAAEYHRGGVNYAQLQEKYGVGCVGTVKKWVEDSLIGVIIGKKRGEKSMVDRVKYDEIMAENRRLKQKVAEGFLRDDIIKWQRESIEELLGKKALIAIEKMTKKKLQ